MIKRCPLGHFIGLKRYKGNYPGFGEYYCQACHTYYNGLKIIYQQRGLDKPARHVVDSPPSDRHVADNRIEEGKE